MSFPRVLTIIAVILFGSIGIAALFKSGYQQEDLDIALDTSTPIEIELEQEEQVVKGDLLEEENSALLPDEDLPDANRIDELFNTRGKKLPIVETITYKSRVPWQKGRPAWISDYAAHYRTSRHFIARSLNGNPDYFKQDVANGDQFNVLRQDKDFSFCLVLDLHRCKMWFYYHDRDTDERVLLKTYNVGLGREDAASASGFLTPAGMYTLGDNVALYRPNTYAFHNGEKVEMIQIFGTRWIPFGKEVSESSAPPKGYGIHGLPWKRINGQLKEDLESIGKHESDGCIRLITEDMEELFAIIITRPTTIELVHRFENAHLPGKE